VRHGLGGSPLRDSQASKAPFSNRIRNTFFSICCCCATFRLWPPRSICSSLFATHTHTHFQTLFFITRQKNSHLEEALSNERRLSLNPLRLGVDASVVVNARRQRRRVAGNRAGRKRGRKTKLHKLARLMKVAN
jgi:hypothetical protein